MNYSIENKNLKISVRSLCGELTSVFSKKNEQEFLWQGDPAVWPWHAPNLFPIVGGAFNNELLIEGKKYHIDRHGFCRKSEFECFEKTSDTLIMRLVSNDYTRKSYPYEFDFRIRYVLVESELKVSYIVQNNDIKPILFSVGAHPAFAIPQNKNEKYEDYYLEFDQTQTLDKHLLDGTGLFDGRTKRVLENSTKIDLNAQLFSEDALVFKNITSKKIMLRSKTSSYQLTMEYSDFEHLGIWAKPNANFVCIEPWLGYADHSGKTTEFKNKEAIISLAPSQTHTSTFEVTIG